MLEIGKALGTKGELSDGLGDAGGLVYQGLDVFFDNIAGAIVLGAIEHGFNNIANSQNIVGDDMAEGLGDFLLTAQKQPLNAEWADFDRMQGAKDHVQGHPVGGIADDQTRDGEYPVALIEKPDHHLDQAKKEPIVEAGVDDKLKLPLATLQKDPVK